MKKIDELLQKRDLVKNEVRGLMTEDKLDEANIKMEEVRKLDKAIALQKELDAEEERDVEEELEKRKDDVDMDKRNKETRELEKRFVDFINGDTRALNVAGNTALIPVHIASQIIEKVKEICPIYSMASIYNVGGDLKFVKENAGLTCNYVEDMAEPSESTPTFTPVTLTNHIAGVLTKVSKSLLNRTDFDLISYVINKVSESIAKFLEKELIKGTSSKAQGISSTTNVLTSSAAGQLTADDLIDLQMSIAEQHQANSCFIMHKDTFNLVRKMKTSDGEYILNKDLTTGFGYVLLGKKVYLSEHVEKVGTGKKAVFYGDMSGLYVKLAQNVEIEVLREHYATQYAIGIVAHVEFDSAVVEDEKIATLSIK